MLSLLRPWALWLSPALAAIAFLYFLRRRFRARPVGSAFLWRAFSRRTDSGRRVQWRSLLLLALQLLAAACAILAAAGPVWAPRSAGRIGTAFIVDASASMAAAPLQEGRDYARYEQPESTLLEAAKDEVGNAIVTLENGDPQALVMVFSAADRLLPLGPPSSGGGKGFLALRALEPTMMPLDEGAVAADLAAWLETQDAAWNVVLYSDGGLDGGGLLLNEAARGALTYRGILPREDDIGLSSLRVEGTALGGAASFSASSGLDQAAVKRFLLSRDGKAVAEGELSVPPGGSRLSLPFASPLAYGAWELSLRDNADALSWNDTTRLSLRPDRRAGVLLVGEGNPYVDSALALPGLSVERRKAFPAAEESSSWDFIIADRVPPPPEWPGKLLILGESGAGDEARFSEWVEGPFDAADSGHPLSRHLPLAEAGSYAGISYAVGPRTAVAASVGGRPVIVSWEEGGWGRVACGADLLASDFGSSLAFPIFFRNLIQRFAPRLDGELSWTFETGRSEFLDLPRDARLLPSSGARLERLTGGASFRAERPGFWEIRSEGREPLVLAVNVAQRESRLGAQQLSLPPPLPAALPGTAKQARNLDKGLLFLLAILLACEWFLWKGLPGRTASGAEKKESRS